MFPPTLFFLSLLMLATSVVADGKTRTRVTLEHGGNDAVGQSLYYLVKEQFRKSAAFELLDNSDNAFIKVRLHTVDSHTPPNGNAAAATVIVTIMPHDSFLSDQVLFVGRNRTQDVAIDIVAGIDRYLEELFRDALKAMRDRENSK